jgi:hypothetical protein
MNSPYTVDQHIALRRVSAQAASPDGQPLAVRAGSQGADPAQRDVLINRIGCVHGVDGTSRRLFLSRVARRAWRRPGFGRMVSATAMPGEAGFTEIVDALWKSGPASEVVAHVRLDLDLRLPDIMEQARSGLVSQKARNLAPPAD